MKVIFGSLKKRDKASRFLESLLILGLFIFLALIPFHLVIKKIVPEPMGTYWKEILLAILVLLSILHMIFSGRFVLPKNRLSVTIGVYIGYILFRFLIDGSGMVGWWGLYISIMYLPIFYVVFIILENNPSTLKKYLFVLVAAGTIISLGGIVEFILNKAIWPSAELTIRQGFPDMYIYGTHIRRVYFVLDSPTTLANTLAFLLPFSLAFLFDSKKMINQLFYGLASVLIFTCIIFTFSRGIWVALTIAFIPIAILFLREKSRIWTLSFVGFLALLAIGIIVVLGNRATAQFQTEKFTYELSASEYKKITLQSTQPLVNFDPNVSDFEIQNWNLPDSIANQNDKRSVLYMHPKSEQVQDEIIFPLEIAQSSFLKFSIAMAKETWSPEKGDGVTFKIYIQDVNNSSNDKYVFVRYVNPKSNPNDRRWRNYLVDLSEWKNKEVLLHLITQSGPNDDNNYDWGGWGELELGQAENLPNVININKSANPIINHVRSIFNWGTDETNRDRLSSWNLGVDAWKKSPIWGMGLGTTGAAALRTFPESAFVTESQLLKSIVELGIPGLLLYLYLWFEITRSLFGIYRDKNNYFDKKFVFALVSSLAVVFIEGLIYQNLEVKQVNAYFWLLVGILVYLNCTSKKNSNITKQFSAEPK